MSASLIKPRASLGAGLLGARSALRRVPLTFGPIDPPVVEPLHLEAVTLDWASEAAVPEVVRQVERLAVAISTDVPAPLPVPHAEVAAGRRVAFTLRLDPARHRALRAPATARNAS